VGSPRALPPSPTSAEHTSAHGPVLPQGIAGWAGAQVGSLSVVASKGTEQRVQGALVNVCESQQKHWVVRFCLPSPPGHPSRCPCHTTVLDRQQHTLTGHHGARLKAISTGTFKTSNDIGARAFSTGVPDRALICVWLGKRKEWSALVKPPFSTLSHLTSF
jgi:hypothetical protein